MSYWLVFLIIALLVWYFTADKPTKEFLHNLAPYVVPREKVYHHLAGGDDLPPSFRYTNLPPVRTQGKCASCWAFAIASCLSDRLSVKTGGAFQKNLSVQEMLSCFAPGAFPCTRGGIPELAFRYAVTQGLHIEDDYPYENVGGGAISRTCKASQGKPWLSDYFFVDPQRHELYPDKVFAKQGSVRSLCDPVWTQSDIDRNVRNMQREIWRNGPIVGTVMVYSDLYKHENGVYRVGSGARFRGGHAVVIVGWTEDAWIVKNSWGIKWPKNGAEPGYFMIARGTNEAEVESRASSAIPLVSATRL